MVGPKEWDSQKRPGRTGQAELDRKNWTVRTGVVVELEGRTGQAEQDGQEELQGQDYQHMTARKRKLGQNQKRTV
jgi:hypothetical protein